MQVRARLISALVFSIILITGISPAMAMTPEQQQLYYAWYSERFGTTPSTPSQPPPATQLPSATRPPSTVQPAQPSALESRMLDLLNADRVKRNLPALEMDPYLVALARLKGNDMVANNYYGHLSPTYGYSYGLLTRYHIQFKNSSECLAVGGSAEEAHYSLMRSPEHYSIMMKPYWTQIGIAFVKRPNAYGYYVVELFIQR